MLKKRYIFLIILVCLFAISTVSAAEISNKTDMVINDYDSALMTESVDENLLTDSYGTFKELQDEIDAVEEGGTLNLTRDYKYVNGSASGVDIYRTITINGNGFYLDGCNQSRILYVGGSNVVLNNLTLINGYAENAGGIAWHGSNGTIKFSVFLNNLALGDGAALYTSDCNLLNIQHCNFTNNEANTGGGIYCYDTNLKIFNTTFIKNIGWDRGGAIHCRGPNCEIDNCTFIKNEAYTSGAINFDRPNCMVNNSIFVENVAYYYGGAFWWIGTNGILNNSILINNKGGAVDWDGAKGILQNLIYYETDTINVRPNVTLINNTKIDNTYPYWTYIVENNDLIKYYNEFNNFTVRILKSEGGYVGANEKVNFIINYCYYDAYTDSNGYASLNEKLQPGNYIVTTCYGGNKVDNTINVLPTLFDKDMNISSSDIYVGETEIINVVLPKDATGTVSTIINNKEYSANISEGVGNIIIDDLCVNYYDIDVIYSGDYQYNYLKDNTSFVVKKISDYNITAEDLTIYKGQSAEIVVNVPSDATGNILLRILSDEYILPIIDGKATVIISDLSDYSMCGFFAFLVDDPKYEMKSVYGTITILPKESDYNIYSPDVDVYCGETANITVYLPQDATGRLKVLYDGLDVGYVYIDEGVATFEATYQISCIHTFNFYYEGNYRYAGKSTSAILTVHEISDYSFNTTDVYISTGETANIIANLPKDASGTANIRVFNENFEYSASTTVSNGKIIFNVDGLLKDAEFIINYLGDYRYESKSVSGSIFVKNSIVINAPDVTKYYGGSERFIVTLTDKNNPISNADVGITIGGKTITRTTDSNGKIFVDLNQNMGTYVVTINYENLSNTSKVIINPAPTKTVLSGVKDINVGDSLTVTATVNATTGSVTFKINSKTQTVDIVNNKASYTIADLSEGSYNIGVSYNDVNGNYLSSSDLASFIVSKISPKLLVIADDIGEGQDAIFEITTNEDCTGDINILIDGKNYKNSLSGGKTIIKVPNLTAGDYNYTVSFLGDKQYGSKSVYGTINVKSINVILNAPDLIKYYGSKDKLSAQLIDKSNKPLSGQKIIFTVNGKDYERITDNLGIASMNVNLISGNHTANVRFEGNGTYDAIKTTVQIQIKSTVSGNNVTKIFRNGTQYYATFVDTGGNLMKNTDVKFNINGVFYTRTTDDKGVAKMNINLPPGTYILTAENPNSTEKYTNVIKVLPSIVENHDLTKYYRNASKYTLRIIGDNGKPVGEGVIVKLNINGVFYERKTDASGYMSMNINLPPGKYTVTAEYNGLRASNTITVLPVLQTKDLKMSYKDGSKFEAKILDGQGKPYAGQTVTFNINGVFYQKVTGDDGVARLTINLPVGDYIITSSYNGLNAANNVKIADNTYEYVTESGDKVLVENGIVVATYSVGYEKWVYEGQFIGMAIDKFKVTDSILSKYGMSDYSAYLLDGNSEIPDVDVEHFRYDGNRYWYDYSY